MGKTRLLVADDHLVLRTGVAAMIKGTELELVAEAATGAEAVRLAKSKKPDVALLDVQMPDGDGLETLKRLKKEAPKVRVLFLSNYDNPTYVARALQMEASGYLLKGCSRDKLLTAIYAVAAGDKAWSREDMRRVTGALSTPRYEGEIDVPLTKRESEVLQKVTLGLTNKEIAKALNIGYETVKEHVQHILRKIGVTDRTQAAVWAVRKQLA